MSQVISANIEEIDGQKVIVKRYSTPAPKKNTKRKIRGRQTHDADLLYKWHRGYAKFG